MTNKKTFISIIIISLSLEKLIFFFFFDFFYHLHLNNFCNSKIIKILQGFPITTYYHLYLY